MIGKIKGQLSELDGPKALIETASGIFYEVFVTPKWMSQHQLGSSVELYTYLQVREDAHVLFGFTSRDENRMFRLLLTVSGVGPKTAFSVVSHTSNSELIRAIKANDTAFFTRVPGLGKKTSMKIILELSQKLDSEFQMQKMYLSDEDKTVIDALVALGYSRQDAQEALSKLPQNLSVEDRIKDALKMNSVLKKRV